MNLYETTEVNIQDDTFRIRNLDSLNWAFRKLSAIQAKEKEIKDLSNAETRQNQVVEDKELSSINDSKEYFERLIQDYHHAMLLINPKEKRFPHLMVSRSHADLKRHRNK